MMDIAMPIQAIESEREILNAFITNSRCIAEYVDNLKSDYFYLESHRNIYKKIEEYYKKNKDIDQIVIINDLKDKVEYKVFEEILNCLGSALKTHISNLKDSYKARELQKVAKDILAKVSKDNINEFIGNLENKFIEIGSSIDKNSFETLEEVQDRTLDEIQKAYIDGNGEGYISGIKTGYQQLDNATGGFKKKQFYIIAARPSMGKSALSLSLVNGIKEDKKIFYVQLDMTKESMNRRLLSMNTGISNRNLMRGKINDKEWEQLALRGRARKNMFITDKSGTTVNDIKSMARKIKNKYGLDIIIIDHIGKIKPSDKGSIYEQVTKISNELKEMSRELDIALICLSQLSRDIEKRADKRPMLSDLRDSGRIEEDADVIMMLYREGYYKAREGQQQVRFDNLELLIQKNRDGLTGKVVFDYDLENQLLKEQFGGRR